MADLLGNPRTSGLGRRQQRLTGGYRNRYLELKDSRNHAVIQ